MVAPAVSRERDETRRVLRRAETEGENCLDPVAVQQFFSKDAAIPLFW
jgi:hypothetical protein